MKVVFREMAKLLRDGQNFVVATIFDKTGSAPRTAGAKMVVRPDGSISGTIGGGRLEADAMKLAREAMESRRTTIQSFNLSSADGAAMDMICGGKGEILIDFVDAADESNRAVCQAAVEILESKEKAWLVTTFGNGPASRQQCLVRRDGTLVGRLDADPTFLAKLTAGPAKISIHAEALDGPRFLVEPIRRAGTAYIFGAGHVSQRIAPLCETVGFRTVVLDDRPEYASHERFPPPTELVVLKGFDPLPELPVDEDSYLVIVTRGHLHDRTVLEQALRTKAGYIGMIGSKRKRDMLYQALLEQGYRREDLARVCSPIGVEILAETPEEIAVSIVGEMIKVRARLEAAK
ncbi:MAG: xanthine dehydrogenase [Anaeromyxobacter sp. RBG_16_69_14]|nr:MAG: xanthine dehydrogenase [Anaeromyxobacter sp. RBG_16_69_14]